MVKTSAFRAISFLWLGSLLGAGCAFFAQVILARVLGKTDFGIFASSLAMVTLLVPLAGFGVAPFWLKVFGEEGWNARRWWRGSFKFVAFSTLLVMLALIFWATFGPHDDAMKSVLWLLLFYVFGQLVIELVSSKLQLEEKYMRLALWQFFPHFFRLVIVMAGAWFFSSRFDVYQAALAYSVVSMLIFFTGFWVLSRMWCGNFSLHGHGGAGERLDGELSSPSAMHVACNAWPFGVAGLFHLVLFQSVVILLQYLDGADSAGVYNAAFVVMMAVYLFPSVIYQKFLLPKLHRWASHDKEALIRSYQRGNLYMLLIGVVALVMLVANSWWAMPLLFGEEFVDSVYIINILALGVPVRFLASSVGSVLVTQNNMRLKVRCMGVVAAFCVTMNIVMIPMVGVIGAALSAVLSDILLLMLYYWAAQKYVVNPAVVHEIVE